MDIKELRVKNLTAFVKAYGGAASLVNAHPELSAAYLWQLINFHRPFGEKSARKIETICKLQPNFFDRIFIFRQKIAIRENAEPLTSHLQ